MKMSSIRNHRKGAATGETGRQAKGLIVEDNYVIGVELDEGFRRMGLDVVGPLRTIDSALSALDRYGEIDAAVLDLNMDGRLTLEIAETLQERRVPFIFYTGYTGVILPDRLRAVPLVAKPAPWADIWNALLKADQTTNEAGAGSLSSRKEHDFIDLLPSLRERARQITANEELAELLVQRTLERAIVEIQKCPDDTELEFWLMGLLETTGIGDRHLLN